MSKAEDVRAMFTRIAGRYDLMNTLMTAGRHHAWRRAAARAASESPPGPILDLATGTGDLAIAIQSLNRAGSLVAADFSHGMLRQARRKLTARGENRLWLVNADALRLPFPDTTFACVASAFLLRNLENLAAGLGEMRRVTRPGGRVVTLEIIRPHHAVWARLFHTYFRGAMPVLGALVAGDRRAYTYLPRSVAGFLTADELRHLMVAVGFRDVVYQTFGLGTVALHVAVV